MPIAFQVLASGSKGNGLLVCSERTHILVDAGLSAAEMVRRLRIAGVDAKRLDAVIVTHEHQDHVRGIGVLSRRFDLPVYMSRGTSENLPEPVGELAYLQLFRAGQTFAVGDLRISPFAISHDAAEPVALVIDSDGCRLGVCTDLGVATHLVRERLCGCQGLVLEANHDHDLLINGPYPWHLKQRIRSRHGHLSNADTCNLLRDIHHVGLQTVILAHLSETNNRPGLILHALQELRCQDGWQRVRFEVGLQHEVGDSLVVS
jgi:phosphoribosyl 1,2-cyclic phosphodiesterase